MSFFADERAKRLEWLSEYLKQIVEGSEIAVMYGKVLDTYITRFGLTDRKAAEDLDLIVRKLDFQQIEGMIRKIGS